MGNYPVDAAIIHRNANSAISASKNIIDSGDGRIETCAWLRQTAIRLGDAHMLDPRLQHSDKELIDAVAEALAIKRADGPGEDDLERLFELTELVTRTPARTSAGRLAKGQLLQTEAADLLDENCCADLVQSLIRDVVEGQDVIDSDGNLIGRKRVEAPRVPPPSALRVEAEMLRSADYAQRALKALIERAEKSDDVLLHALARHAAIEVDPMLRRAIQAADRIDYLSELSEPAEPEVRAAA